MADTMDDLKVRLKQVAGPKAHQTRERQLMAAAFMAGYCTNRDSNAQVTSQLIDRIQGEFERFMAACGGPYDRDS